MKRTSAILCVILLICLSVIGASAKSALDTTIVFIEAEDCAHEGYEVVDKDGAVGKTLHGLEAETNKFTVTFNAPADGQYSLWLKVFSESGTDNSLKYTLPDGVERVFDFMENALSDPEFPFFGKWVWVQMGERGTEPLANGYGEWNETNGAVWHTPVYIDAKAGENSVTFICREAGHYIDQVIITDDLAYQPGAVEGNHTYRCAMCNMDHYVLEPYADLGIKLEDVWNAKVSAERAALETAAPETVAEEPAETAEAVSAPVTYDAVLIGLAIPAAASLLLAFRKRGR